MKITEKKILITGGAGFIEPVLLKISIAPEYLNEYNVCFLFKCAWLSLKTIPKGLKIVLVSTASISQKHNLY